ncbi:MAG: hypothetical protein AAF490_24840 [Chloroflexota bacterium]
MSFLKRSRFFLLFLLGILALILLIIFLAPTALFVRLTPAQPTDPIGIPLSNRTNIQAGRQDMLFHLSSQIQGEASIQQFVHYYFREETAVSNFNQNLAGNPDWFPDGAEAYRVDLPSRNFPEQLLCHQLTPDRLLCEYRAQIGHWTVHTDFVSRNTAVFDEEVIENWLLGN